MSRNEDHPMRQEGTFSEPKLDRGDRLMAKVYLRAEQFNDILGINEAYAIGIWIATICFGVTALILGAIGIADLWERYLPAGHETNQRLHECQESLDDAQERTARYETFLSERLTSTDRLF